MNILEELQWRELVAATTCPPEVWDQTLVTDKDLNVQFVRESKEKIFTLYCGFDPTADSLHVGNLFPSLALRRFQLFGHHPIAVAGGATGSIGDPSGKTTERSLLTREALEHNIARVKVQLTKLLEFDASKTPKNNPARLMDNASWTANV